MSGTQENQMSDVVPSVSLHTGMLKEKLTQKRLKEVLDYNPDTGVFVWKSKRRGTKGIGNVAGCKMVNGYITICIFGKEYLAHRLAWLYMEGYMPNDLLVDHKDRYRSNNKIDNLRLANRQCNMRNSGNQKNNTSGVKGVGWIGRLNKWRSRIVINGKEKSLGCFDLFYDAVMARLNAEREYGWSECDSSSPAFKYINENKRQNR